MHLFRSIAGLRCYLDGQRFNRHAVESAADPEKTPSRLPFDVGFVPTMGALHAGHLSLIQRARRENKLVVVSIFVNPLQFAPTEDLHRYPSTLELDKVLCEAAGVDVLFVPNVEEMGVSRSKTIQPSTRNTQSPTHASFTQIIPSESLTSVLCGRTRTGHFQGVAVIVTKLLNLVEPTRAYFGQKDAQQLAIIRRLVADLNLSAEIVGCPIVRERSGLALSSRNQYLTMAEREQAAAIYRGLQQAVRAFRDGERSRIALTKAVQQHLAETPAIATEYIELVHPTTLEPIETVQDSGLLAVAARIGSTRLIDNVLLSSRKPIVAIDGPAGAGKSTVAKLVAQALELFYLDTGAMYRAITWLVLQSGISIADEPAIAELLSQCRIEFIPGSPSIFVNGQEVTQAIRTLEVTSKVSEIAAQPAVRHELVQQQQRYGQQGGIVVEGRDIGTYVFPDAELKIFLTASVQERARRRQQDLINQGIEAVSLEQLEQSIHDRDRKDSTRLLAPLRKATDAIELQTDDHTISQVVEKIVMLYWQRLKGES